MKIKTYSELSKLSSFMDRFEYLILGGVVGNSTFGADRYLNQNFYRSSEWRSIRNKVIIRDNACDLGIIGYDIYDKVYVHHMNPITPDDIRNNYELLIDPEYLISTSFNTHQAITFGSRKILTALPKERKKGDTKLW